MSDAEALAVLDSLHTAGVRVWLDGGWGVDALLGRQTRPHDDLDLVVPADQVGTVRDLLDAAGFVIERDWLPTALAMRHTDGRAVDLHPIEETADGGGDQLLPDGSRWHYDEPVHGRIKNRRVRCCSVATQIRSHLGYEPDDDDLADLRALADHFGVRLPAGVATGSDGRPTSPYPDHVGADIDRLLDERESQLRAELAELTRSAGEVGSISFGKRVGEGTSLAVDRLASVSAQEQLLAMLEEVRRARQRVADGSYGLCEVCGKPIPEERLEVRPWAVRCVQHS